GSEGPLPVGERVLNGELWPVLANSQRNAQGNDTAFHTRLPRSRRSDERKLTPFVPVEFQLPRLAVDNKKLSNSQLLVKRKLCASVVSGACYLNHEICCAAPKRAKQFGTG